MDRKSVPAVVLPNGCFEHRFSFDPGDLVHLRKRIWEAGAEKILQYSVRLHGTGKGWSLTKAAWHVSDTTAPENNTMVATDAKQCKKVLDHCGRIGEREGIRVRRSYRLQIIIKNPRSKLWGIEDFSLKYLSMRGNKSPAPPVFRPKGRGIKPLRHESNIMENQFDPRTIENEEEHKIIINTLPRDVKRNMSER